MKTFKLFLSCILVSSHFCLQAQTIVSQTLKWSENPVIHNPTGQFPLEIFHFEGCFIDDSKGGLPVFSYKYEVSGPGSIQVNWQESNFENLEKKQGENDQFLAENISVNTVVHQNRNQFFAEISFVPITKSGNSYEKLSSFRLSANFRPQATQPTNITRGPDQSVLATGQVFKMAINQTGMHKIDKDFLESLGVVVNDINPKKIQIFGNRGGRVPELISTERDEDLVENPVFVSGQADGSFDDGDFILFYAESADRWYYNDAEQGYNLQKNVFDDKNYYFLKIGAENGLRIQTKPDVEASYVVEEFDDFARIEADKYNLLREFASAQGSGKNWMGDIYKNVRTHSYDFNFPNIIATAENPARIKADFYGRYETDSHYKVKVAGEEFSETIIRVQVSNVESTYVRNKVLAEEFTTGSEEITVEVDYPALGNGSNVGWLDYLQVNTKRELKMTGDMMDFRDIQSMDQEKTRFILSNAGSNIEIWNISNPLAPSKCTTQLDGSQMSFGAATQSKDAPKDFIAFNKNADLLQPDAIGEIANQNLHELPTPQLLIIYPSEFLDAAQTLATHRKEFSGLTVQLAEIGDIYNEFSSGRVDPAAIRDFARYLSHRSDMEGNSMLEYLLLFGDGSFDYRNILELEADKTHNFIPVYETDNSTHPINSYPSDDFYGLLSDNEGTSLLTGELDIAVGRLPVRTAGQAMSIVQKIIRYDTDPAGMGDWRNRITHNADDQDHNLHLKDADHIAQKMIGIDPVFNHDKIYFDAFVQISTPGGERFPTATEAINRNMFRGHLIMSYLGHGGSTGWAQERVLTIQDITSWNNSHNLPLVMTATCSFAGYDEPNYTTGGEHMILNSDGGAIGLYTTVRAVFAGPNSDLTEAAYDHLIGEDNIGRLTIGEALRRAKNTSIGSGNTRKFTLLGDPAQHLAIPRYQVATTTINGNSVNEAVADTIQALQEVTITGQILDDNNEIMTDFNGKIYPTIFDKKTVVNTLGQNEDSTPVPIQLQKNIIFKGVASVTNGNFTFSFVVPKDIDYTYGYGKISYYATDETSRDANGAYTNIIIGGTDPNGVQDDLGPLVEVFMNDENFVFGGITNENPKLYVKLSDDYGINVVGNSIGHDLTGFLDGNTESPYSLNDFYQSALDDYTRGTVTYPLENLEEGRHHIKVKAWDISNNSGEGFTEFVVAKTGKAALDHVLNYPNPFTTSTSFQFEHNLPDQEIDVLIRIFTVSGKIVKTIQQTISTSGFRLSDQITWDGRDDYGDDLARGIYLYKVKVRANGDTNSEGSTESDFEKLVILK